MSDLHLAACIYTLFPTSMQRHDYVSPVLRWSCEHGVISNFYITKFNGVVTDIIFQDWMCVFAAILTTVLFSLFYVLFFWIWTFTPFSFISQFQGHVSLYKNFPIFGNFAYLCMYICMYEAPLNEVLWSTPERSFANYQREASWCTLRVFPKEASIKGCFVKYPRGPL